MRKIDEIPSKWTLCLGEDEILVSENAFSEKMKIVFCVIFIGFGNADIIFYLLIIVKVSLSVFIFLLLYIENNSFHIAFQGNKFHPEKVSLLGDAGFKSDHQRFQGITAVGERVDEDILSVSTSSRGLYPFLTLSAPSPDTNDFSLELTLTWNHMLCA